MASDDVRALARDILAGQQRYGDKGLRLQMEAPARAVLAQETRPTWQPIETYGTDELNPTPIVLRPHRIHGPMDVRRLTDAEREAFKAADTGALTRDIDWRWVNGDYTTMWTESAFWPFWMPMPAPPDQPREDEA